MKTLFLLWFYIYLTTVHEILSSGSKPRTSLPLGSSCQTPDETNGTCIEILKCKSLLTMILKQPVPPNDRDFLRKSHCGGRPPLVLVCCSDKATKAEFTADMLPNRCGGHFESFFFTSETSISFYPWVAIVQYTKANGEKEFPCSGALINEKYVLTTARCVNQNLLEPNQTISGIRLGEHNINKESDCDEYGCADPVLDISIDKIIIHEEYNKTEYTEENDIALVQLSKAVEFTDFVQPICLPLSNSVGLGSSDSRRYLITGWGSKENDSTIEKKQDFPRAVPTDQCNGMLKNQDRNINVGPNHICIGNQDGFDDCRVNSGNPLMAYVSNNRFLRLHLTGLFSFGPVNCLSKEKPSVYTRIESYIPWILEHMHT